MAESGIGLPQAQPASSPLPVSSRIEVILQSPAVEHQNGIASLIPYLAWPIAAVIVVLLLRRSIANALTVFSTRINKLSVAGVAIELEAASARFTSSEAIDELRDTAKNAAFADSSNQLKANLATDEPADYAIVNIETGEAWLTSRLYLLASLAARMRKIRSIIFIGTVPGRQQAVFICATSTDKLQWALASSYPWLEEALGSALALNAASAPIMTMEKGDPPYRPDGRLTDFGFAALVGNYLSALQVRNADPPIRPGSNGRASDWTKIGEVLWERGAWVTRNLLRDILEEDYSRAPVIRRNTTSNEELARAILRAEGDLVPIVDEQRVLRQVIKRRDFVNRVIGQAAADS